MTRFFENVLLSAFVLSSSIVSANMSVEQITEWIQLEPKIDPPVPGTVIFGESIENLSPWIMPGLFEELSFSEVKMTIQKTQSFLPHESFINATTKHKEEARISPDGSLENYKAGQPFSDSQILGASSEVAGYMIAWNHNHRWQHYGQSARKMPLVYLGTEQGAAPLDPKLGLMGEGSIDRFLMFDYRKVYLNHIPMLANQHYRVATDDAKYQYFKEFYEFLSPHDVAGTMFLIERKLDQRADDQVNIYSPTERRVRRYSAKERADPILGSEATLDDVEVFSGRVLDYKWNLLGERKVMAVSNSSQDSPMTFGPYSRVPLDSWQLRSCYALELESILPDHPYKKRFLFLDKQTYSVTASLIINREDQVWKVMYNVYSWKGSLSDSDPTTDIEKSVPHIRYSGFIDLIANTATLVYFPDLEYPVMTPRKIKRQYGISNLSEGR